MIWYSRWCCGSLEHRRYLFGQRRTYRISSLPSYSYGVPHWPPDQLGTGLQGPLPSLDSHIVTRYQVVTHSTCDTTDIQAVTYSAVQRISACGRGRAWSSHIVTRYQAVTHSACGTGYPRACTPSIFFTCLFLYTRQKPFSICRVNKLNRIVHYISSIGTHRQPRKGD